MSIHIDAPAFPQFQPDGVPGVGWFGLTKREWFAGLAMQGMLAGVWTDDDMTDYDNDPVAFSEHQSAIAKSSVDYADALIAALNAEPRS